MANGCFLYLFPERAEADYAWPIRPTASARFLGAGYLAGLLAPAIGLFAVRRWRSLQALLWGFLVLGTVATLATVLHLDRFRWGYPLTWLWTAVYVGIPPVAAWVLRHQRRVEPSDLPDLHPRVQALRPLLASMGAVAALLGALLFVASPWVLSAWGWQLTPLLSRVFAAWYLLVGTTLLSLAASARRPHELVVGLRTFCAWSCLLLAIPVFDAESMSGGSPGLVLWIVGHSLLLLVSLALDRAACRWMRESGETL
jgi:hypothetical protein